jgi:hypothetical protein
LSAEGLASSSVALCRLSQAASLTVSLGSLTDTVCF